MKAEKKSAPSGSGKKYIISLNKWRSVVALIACLVTVVFALYAVAGGMVLYAQHGDRASGLFQYFTTNSNMLTALGAGFIVPFAVEGIRKKRFTYPKWLAMIHYCGTICTTLTMVVAVGMISWFDPELAFGGYNIFLHIVCPLMVLVSFFFVDAGLRFTVRDAVYGIIPLLIYEAVYAYEVLLVGEENGGWPDMYQITGLMPAPAAFAVLTLFGFGTALLIRLAYNKVAQSRLKHLQDGLWPDGADPVEIKIEMFGLGRYMGSHADKEYVELPLDLINMIAVRYNIKPEELAAPYIRGCLDSLTHI